MHVIVGPRTNGNQIPGNKFRLARLLTLRNFVVVRQNVRQDSIDTIYRTICFFKENNPVGREELDQSSPNLWRPVDQCPSSCQISSCTAKWCIKNVKKKFLPTSNFGTPGGPLGPKFTSPGNGCRNTSLEPLSTKIALKCDLFCEGLAKNG